MLRIFNPALLSWTVVATVVVVVMGATPAHVYAQDDDGSTQGGAHQPTADQVVILAGFAVATAAVFVYLARDSIMRRGDRYADGRDLGSAMDRDYEKYHSDWADGYEEVGSRSGRMRNGGGAGDDAAGNPYEVMGINSDATQEEIKKRYRILARENHPDKSGHEGARDRMAEINRAYEVLSDPDQRSEYDKSRPV